MLSNSEIITQMLTDLEKVDKSSIGTQGLYVKSEGDDEAGFDKECKWTLLFTTVMSDFDFKFCNIAANCF